MLRRLRAFPDSTLSRSELVGESHDQLTRDEEKGWILEGANRIISFRAKTFQALTDSLTRLVGPMTAAVVLNQLGIAIGRAAMSYSKDKIESQNDLPAVVDSVLSARGWGRCLDLTRQSTGGRTIYVFKLKGTPMSYERKSTEPSCHMMRGILSGWLEAFSDAKAVNSMEKECESMGKQFCVFEVVLEKRFEGAGTIG